MATSTGLVGPAAGDESKLAEQADDWSPVEESPEGPPEGAELREAANAMGQVGVTKFAGLDIATGKGSFLVKAGRAIMLYGPPGSGKTTAACRIARSKLVKRALLCDAEGGAEAVADMIEAGEIDLSNVTSWSQMEKLKNGFMRAPREFPWDVLIFDNLSEFQPLHMETLTRVAPTLPEYHNNTIGIKRFCGFWRDAAKAYGLTVIFCLWEDSEKDEFSGILKRTPGVTPKLAGILPGMMDIVGYMSPVERKPELRQLSMAPSKRTVSKFRRAPTKEALQIPHEVQFGLDQNVLADIMDVTRGGTAWPSGKYKVSKEVSE